MALIGVVWTAVFLWRGGGPTGVAQNLTFHLLIWGLVSGLFSAFANILLIEAMARQEAGICSTIYRLNLAPAALMGILLLGERVTPAKILGLSLAVAATLLFFQPGSRHRTVARAGAMGLWIVALAALLRAAMGIAYKYGLGESAPVGPFLALNGAVWIAAGLVYHLFGVRRQPHQPSDSRRMILYGLVSGVLVCGIVLFMARALQVGDASTVLPVAQLSFAFTALGGVVFMKESCTPRKVWGLILAALSILAMVWGQNV